MAGHSNLNTTQRYIEVDADYQRRVVELFMNNKNFYFIAFTLLISGCVTTTGVKLYPGYDLPERAYPNKETLEVYLNRYINDAYSRVPVKSEGSLNPQIFKKSIKNEPLINHEIENTALISYALIENNEIKIDLISPAERFGKIVKNDTPLLANSISKSIVSYMLGHAICKGYIDNLQQDMSDWTLLDNTLYKNKRIFDLINMTAGDQFYITKNSGTLINPRQSPGNSLNPYSNSQGNVNNRSISGIMKNELLNSKTGEKTFNYTSLPPKVILNYIIYKTGNEFPKFYNNIFQNYIKTEYPVIFLDNNYFRSESLVTKDDGSANAIFYLTRYDYIRFANTILNDWHNDTCVGKYLKTIMANKVSKGVGDWREDSTFGTPKSYGGFFHFDYDYPGLRGKNIIGMDGYGGQMILINLDENRIIVTNAIHLNYDYKRIVYQVAATGKP